MDRTNRPRIRFLEFGEFIHHNALCSEKAASKRLHHREMIKRNSLSRDVDVPGFTDEAVLAFIYDAVIWKQPTVSLEIGTFMGRSALTICEALEELNEGELISVDFYTQASNEKYLERPFMQEMLDGVSPATRKLYTNFEELKWLEDCYSLTVSRHEVMQKRSRLVKADTQNFDFMNFPPIDFAYIDGAHSYEGVRNDFIGVLSRLKPGGLVIFDDYSSHFPGVVRLIRGAQSTGGLLCVGEEKQDIGFMVPDPDAVLSTLTRKQKSPTPTEKLYDTYWNFRYNKTNRN